MTSSNFSRIRAALASVLGQRSGRSGTEVGFGIEAEALPQDAHGGGDLRIDLGEIGPIGRDLGYAAVVADRLKLFVGKAARVVVDGLGSGVRGDDRGAGRLHDVGGRPRADMTYIDHDTLVVERCDKCAAEVAQARVVAVAAGAGRIGGAAELVVAEMGDGDVPRAALGPHGDRFGHLLGGGAQRIAVLDPDQGDQLALRIQRLDLVGGGGQSDRIRVGAQHPKDAAILLLGGLDSLGVAFLSQLALRRVNNEEAGIEAAYAHRRQIDLRPVDHARIEQGGAVARADVDVAVDGQEPIVDRHHIGIGQGRLGERGPRGKGED